MKTKIKMGLKKALAVIFLLICVGSYAQNEPGSLKPSLTVLNIDAQGISLNAEQLGNLVRLEISKLDRFEVMDRYDVAYLVCP